MIILSLIVQTVHFVRGQDTHKFRFLILNHFRMFQNPLYFGRFVFRGQLYHPTSKNPPGVAWDGFWLAFYTMVLIPILQMSVTCCTNLMYESGWLHSLNLSCSVVQEVGLFPSVLNFFFRKYLSILSKDSHHHRRRKEREHKRQWMLVQK